MRGRTARELMEVARTWSLQSTCSRRQVGCVLAGIDIGILAYASNQGVAGQKCPPVHTAEECITLHAEAACVASMALNGISTEDAVAYVTCAPCAPCARLLVAAGIQAVFYSDLYRNNEGLYVLRRASVHSERLEVA